jgi:uncharacterized coiled-coil DUF342 family protein
MTMDRNAAFAVIQRELEEFNTDVGKACAEQAQAKETIDSVEYEMEQLRKLIAENALSPSGEKRYAQLLSDVEILGENVGSGLLRRLLGRAA